MNTHGDSQLRLFSAGQRRPEEAGCAKEGDGAETRSHAQSRVVHDLGELVSGGEQFRCIYADPPWAYENTACRGAAARHYKTMSLRELCELPVRELAESDAHLHLWTTSSFLFDAKRVIDAWGFQYKSSFVWCKPVVGCGNYWRLAHELLCDRSHKSTYCWAFAVNFPSATAPAEAGFRRSGPFIAASRSPSEP